MRSISLYINTIVMMALEALCFYTVYPPTLMTECTTYVTECNCTKMMGPCVARRSRGLPWRRCTDRWLRRSSRRYDWRAPACAWVEEGHTEDWSEDGCMGAPSAGACAFRSPDGKDPYIFLVFMFLCTVSWIPIASALAQLFGNIITAPLGRAVQQDNDYPDTDASGDDESDDAEDSDLGIPAESSNIKPRRANGKDLRLAGMQGQIEAAADTDDLDAPSAERIIELINMGADTTTVTR
jgi:hypothetical protein